MFRLDSYCDIVGTWRYNHVWNVRRKNQILQESKRVFTRKVSRKNKPFKNEYKKIRIRGTPTRTGCTKKIASALECEVSDIDENIIIHRHTVKFEATSEDIERARQGVEARRLAAKLESGEDITNEEHQLIADYIEREKESIPRLRESIKNFSNAFDEWGEHILVAKYRELNITGKRESVKRIDELTELSQYTEPDEPDTSQE